MISHQRKCAHVHSRNRSQSGSVVAISTKGSPGRCNETDGQTATARSPMSHTSHLQSTTSSQAQIKCSLYPPCFPTTITNHHHRHHHQRCGCRCRTDSACILAVHGLQLRHTHCASKTLSLSGPSHPRGPLSNRRTPGTTEVELRKCAAPHRADVLSALIRPFQIFMLTRGRIHSRLIEFTDLSSSRNITLIHYLSIFSSYQFIKFIV